MSKKKKIAIATDEEVAEFGGDAEASAEASSDAQSEEAVQPQAASELQEWKDKALRAKADFLNDQKRSEKEKSDSFRFANAGFARSLLPVIDDLERVIQAGGADTVVDGVRLTLDNLMKTLNEFHVTPIDAEGQPFDPVVHEAVMEQPSAEHEVKTVLQVVAKGYRMHDRVLRPAKVIVSKPVEQAESSS